MLISTNWLKDFVSLEEKIDSEELSLQLTMHSFEVEEIRDLSENLENVVVGEIKTLSKHPDADKLTVCEVGIGDETVEIVCGGSNLREGMKIALGKVGAKVKWHGEGDLVELKPTKIRGVKSLGMICAAEEIGLGEIFPKSDEKEILDLGDIEDNPGTPLASALGFDDLVIDVDNKSITHRPDLWGHYGVAREIAALRGEKLKKLDPARIKEGKNKIEVDVEDPVLCPRYMAVGMEGIKIGDSPEWMQKKLLSVGLRPINNIVDITNYIMQEIGQPMHAFDAQKLGSEIKIRHAERGEKFTALDKTKHKLTEEMLVIADSSKPVAVAGVIGGEDSGVTENTTSVVFESANFHSTNVRRTALALGIRTDSSTRFEKSLDPNNCELALRRAVELVLEIIPGSRVSSRVADDSNFNLNQGPIRLELDFLNEKIGVEIEKKKVISILENLGFGVKDKKDILVVSVPSWRATKDISIPEDLVEEVARIYGYENIPVSLPKFSITPPPENALRDIIRSVQTTLARECGFNETSNYSFISPELLEKLELDTRKYIELDNPVSKDRPFLRRTLIANMLENVESNLHRFDRVALFEVGRTYIAEEKGMEMKPGTGEFLPKQDTILGVVFAQKDLDAPFYEVSGCIDRVSRALSTDLKVIKSDSKKYLLAHPGRLGEIMLGKQNVGYISELHPKLQQKMGIVERVAILELNLSILSENLEEIIRYESPAEYPEVGRDIAFVCDAQVAHVGLVESMKNLDKLISKIELFDVYTGKGIEKGKKSMAYHVEYRSDQKTLEAGEVDQIHEKLIEELKSKFGVEVR